MCGEPNPIVSRHDFNSWMKTLTLSLWMMLIMNYLTTKFVRLHLPRQYIDFINKISASGAVKHMYNWATYNTINKTCIVSLAIFVLLLFLFWFHLWNQSNIVKVFNVICNTNIAQDLNGSIYWEFTQFSSRTVSQNEICLLISYCLLTKVLDIRKLSSLEPVYCESMTRTVCSHSQIFDSFVINLFRFT